LYPVRFELVAGGDGACDTCAEGAGVVAADVCGLGGLVFDDDHMSGSLTVRSLMRRGSNEGY
jgi:hypothetical protein